MHASTERRLPGLAQDLAEVIGREKALRLIGQLPPCGSRSWRVNLYVPRQLQPDHMLVRVLGWHDARRLVREFGGMILELPICRAWSREHRDAAIVRMAEEGTRRAVIACVMGISDDRVKRILSGRAARGIRA